MKEVSMKINVMYFSPTGTTKKVTDSLSKRICKKLNEETQVKYIDFTPPIIREKSIAFGKKELLIIGVPVYAGRVPNILLKYLNTLTGSDTIAMPLVVYGNRNYDDALLELKNILEANGFIPIAAAAFIGEHSFSDSLAKNRPDEKDLKIVEQFADQILERLYNLPNAKKISVSGQQPLRPYYKPTDINGNFFDFRKITPKTSSNCIDCKACVDLCPMGSINREDVSTLNGICIKCCACIKSCPTQAKYFDDSNYIKHKNELETNFSKRKEPELFF